MDETPMPAPVASQMHAKKSCNCMWCAGGGALTGAAIVAIAVGLWYFYSLGTPPPAAPEAPVVETAAPVVDPVQLAPITAGNTTADISADLSQLPDTTAALSADAAAASSTILGL
jgi:hypothetical protein